METVQAPVLKGALMIAMLHLLLLEQDPPQLVVVLALVILLALPLAPMTALAGAKEPVQVDVVVHVIIHAAFLVKLHVIIIVLLFVLYLLCTLETQKRVY